MPFSKVRGGVVILLLGDNVVGRRGSVAQHQIAFAFQEQAVGFAPAFGDGNGFRGQLLPRFRRFIPVDFLHPQ